MKRAGVVVTNYHAFMHKDRSEGSEIARRVAGQKKGDLRENDAVMVERVCRDLRGDILVLNDEAHHCYRPTASKFKSTTTLLSPFLL